MNHLKWRNLNITFISYKQHSTLDTWEDNNSLCIHDFYEDWGCFDNMFPARKDLLFFIVLSKWVMWSFTRCHRLWIWDALVNTWLVFDSELLIHCLNASDPAGSPSTRRQASSPRSPGPAWTQRSGPNTTSTSRLKIRRGSTAWRKPLSRCST